MGRNYVTIRKDFKQPVIRCSLLNQLVDAGEEKLVDKTHNGLPNAFDKVTHVLFIDIFILLVLI